MKLIEFPEQTVVFAKDQPEYLPLPAHKFLNNSEQGRIAFCWRLTWRERFKVLFSGLLWQQVLTFNHPLQPQLLGTEKPDMAGAVQNRQPSPLEENYAPMKASTLSILLLTLAITLPAAEPAPPAPPATGKLFADTFLSLTTPDFKATDYGYGLGVGYQITKTFAADVRLTHDGLNIENNAVSAIGARLVATPFQSVFLRPYGFLGASFDLRPDEWRLQPGLGCEFGITKLMKGLSVFGEASVDVGIDMKESRNGYLLLSGLRWRF